MKPDEDSFLGNVWIKLLFFVGLIAIFLFICNFLMGILISLFLAFTVAYIFDPIVDFIERRERLFAKIKIRRSFAICILILGVTMIAGGLLTYAIPKTVTGMQQVGSTIKQRFPDVRSNVVGFVENYGNKDIVLFLKNQFGLNDDTEEAVSSNLERGELAELSDSGKMQDVNSRISKYSPKVFKFVTHLVKKVFSSTFGFFGVVINFFIFSVVTIYLLKDFDVITAKIRNLIPLDKKEKFSAIFSKIDENLKEFFRGQVIVCLILSSIYCIGLTVVGVPLSFVLGIVAGFGNVIPYFGTIIGFGLAMVITFFQFHDIQHIAYVCIVFGFGQLMEGIVITPRIIGGKLGLNPVVVIVSILIWSQLLGFLGLLLAVPITAVAKVLIDEGVIRYKDSDFYKKSLK